MSMPENRHSGFKIRAKTDSVFLGVLDSCSPETMFTEKRDNSPIALNIHFQNNLIPDYVKLLCREMSMYSHRFGKRNAVKTWFRGAPLNELSSGEITEIAFLTANHFHMNESAYSEYGFECRVKDITENNLSLMKGLRFTTLLLNIDAGMPPENPAITSALTLIQQYTFREFHLRLHTSNSDKVNLCHWLEFLATNHPALLEVSDAGKERQDTLKPGDIANLMAKQGYTLLGDRFFVIKDHPLVQLKQHGKLQYTPPWGVSHADIKDWVGLGIGAIGRIGGAFYQNLHKDKEYTNNLLSGELPICCSGHHPNHQGYCAWTMIEQLICHHRISLKPRSKENENVKKVLETACERGWMTARENAFTLTTRGLNHLRDICLSLQHC